MTRGETMRRVRAQAQLVRRLSEQLRERPADGLRSPGFDGTFRGGSRGQGLDVRMERREAMRRILEKESALLREYEQEARAYMDAMKPEHYAFCALYYLAALPLEEAGEAIDRSARQCARYKREIEGEQETA